MGTIVGGPVGGEVGSIVGEPDGGEVGSIVGGPVGGEVGSKNSTLERVLQQVFGVITALRLEALLVQFVGVLESIQAEVREDEHGILTCVGEDFDCCCGSLELSGEDSRVPPSSRLRRLRAKKLAGRRMCSR